MSTTMAEVVSLGATRQDGSTPVSFSPQRLLFLPVAWFFSTL